MKHQGIELTDEQNFAVDCITKGGDTTIQAPAGSGKTFLLKAASTELKKSRMKGSYISFNRAIANEAKATFPSNVECRTSHSLAFGREGYKYKHRFKKLTGGSLAKIMDIGETEQYPTKATKGYLILDTIRKFCYSQDREITSKNMPYIPKKLKDDTILNFWYKDIPIQANKVWEEMINVKSDMPVTHDMYLKLWALNYPFIQKDFIMIDESQDSNPVLIGIVNDQEHAQKIWVGDKYQQIYQWRGATNAMDMMNTANKANISQSFRFGQSVAEVANNILQMYTPEEEKPIIIKGNINRNTKVEQIEGCPDAVICRTNAGIITNVFKYIGLNKKVYIQNSNNLISLINGIKKLQSGKKAITPDLALFSNWTEVLEFIETDEGHQLKRIIKLVENYGTDTLLKLLKKTETSMKKADVSIITGHASKGLEWSKVKLDNDFLYPEKGTKLSAGEINILYVSATRALDVLDITDCLAANVKTVLKLNS